MSSKPPAASPAPEETPPVPRSALGSVLATRGRTVVVGLALAFVGGAGAAAFAIARNAGESATKRVLGESGAPLQVRIARPGTFESGHLWAPYYVIPKNDLLGPDNMSKAELTKLRDSAWVDEAWAKRHGGVAGSPEVIRLELRGKSDEPVTVTAIRAEVVSARKPPVKGWYIAAPAGCGIETIQLANIQLDASPPSVSYFEDDASPESRHLALFVTRTDAEQIELWAYTRKSTLEWRARVFYTGADGDGSLTIDDNGQPFRVTTETASDGYRGNAVGNRLVTREHYWDKNGVTSC